MSVYIAFFNFNGTMRKLLLSLLMLAALLPMSAQNTFKRMMRDSNPEFFKTAEARRVGDQLLLYQRVTGGWPKNIDMARELTDQEREEVLANKQRRNVSMLCHQHP